MDKPKGNTGAAIWQLGDYREGAGERTHLSLHDQRDEKVRNKLINDDMCYEWCAADSAIIHIHADDGCFGVNSRGNNKGRPAEVLTSRLHSVTHRLMTLMRIRFEPCATGDGVVIDHDMRIWRTYDYRHQLSGVTDEIGKLCRGNDGRRWAILRWRPTLCR